MYCPNCYLDKIMISIFKKHELYFLTMRKYEIFFSKVPRYKLEDISFATSLYSAGQRSYIFT